MGDLLTFRFCRQRPLTHAGRVQPTRPGWSKHLIVLKLLCERRGEVGAWEESTPATLDNVTCPRCRAALRGPRGEVSDG